MTLVGQKGNMPAPEKAERIFEEENTLVQARTYAAIYSAFWIRRTSM